MARGRNIVYIATSLDGYIADREGRLDWLHSVPNPEGSDFGFAQFMKGIDALVMGRNTFEMVHSFGQWPYAKPVCVLSGSLKTLPAGYETRAFLAQGRPEEVLKLMAGKGYKNLYIDGGRTIQNFLRGDLIDEIILTRIPILLGGGSPLFDLLPKEIPFKLKSSEVLLGQMVKSHYVREG